MARLMDFSVKMRVFLYFSFVLIVVMADASSDETKTVEFNVKPGGVVHTFSETIGEHECSFTYASQGGTNEVNIFKFSFSHISI
ncbi:hypothetical protein NHX12_033438 [Muraenolepis orangiensis]|uniref:GOLD domain-containing protein n=1 Tax=Muraenolepis orangiensis TaxID=630683 RepID=A0A9Q0E7M7_9TELE|nr:hypothetical protein NHX12_033438 [Muraenolepis orangiensis]